MSIISVDNLNLRSRLASAPAAINCSFAAYKVEESKLFGKTSTIIWHKSVRTEKLRIPGWLREHATVFTNNKRHEAQL